MPDNHLSPSRHRETDTSVAGYPAGAGEWARSARRQCLGRGQKPARRLTYLSGRGLSGR